MASASVHSNDDGRSLKDDDLPSIKEEDWFESETQQVSSKDYDPTPDKRDMRRLGKRQELKACNPPSKIRQCTSDSEQRRFRFFSIVGYAVILGLTWEFSLVTSVFSLSNGGPAGAIWLNLFVCCGMSTVMLSMAEVASMAPTSGGQYHWVSEFAPRHLQKPMSFAVGWLSAFGWQAAMPSVAFMGAQQVLALISICDRNFVIKGWHGALITMAFVLAAIFFNTVAIGKLPILEGLAVIFHFFGFFAFIVIMWVMGPRANAKDTLTTFEDGNNWGNFGLATLIAMVGPVATYLGGDCAVHLGEELKDASYVLPRAMVSASAINYVLGFTTTVTLMFSLGNVDADLADVSGQPWVAIIYRITGSKAATIVLIVVMITMVSSAISTFKADYTLTSALFSTSFVRSTKLQHRLVKSLPSPVTRACRSTPSWPKFVPALESQQTQFMSHSSSHAFSLSLR